MAVRVLSAAVLVALLIVTIWWLPSWATVVLATIAAAMGLVELFSLAKRAAFPLPLTIALIAYVAGPLGLLAWIRVWLGPAPVTWLIAVISISDSAQYFTGRAFGRNKLAPVISPGKTIEGAVGGLVVATAAGALLAPLWLKAVPVLSAATAAAGLALFGMAGDLFESLLKRSAGAKDSSTLIPGHGGVLDRVDAYLFAAPVYYLFLRFAL